MPYRFFSILFVVNFLLMTAGCSTLSMRSSSNCENKVTTACANNPILMADLTQRDFLKHSRLSDECWYTDENNCHWSEK